MENPGIISFKIYLIVLILILVLLIAYTYYLRKDNIDKEKLDKIVELFKFSIGTIAIATIATMVSDLFKERDYDKNEMVTFNEYLPYVMDSTSTIEKKMNLCQFFKSVTPNGELKEGWKSYYEDLQITQSEIKKKNLELSRLQKNLQSNKNSEETLIKMDMVEKEKQLLLNSTNSQEKTLYLVVFGADKDKEQANYELEWARKNYNPLATIYKKSSWYRTTIPYSNYDTAKQIATQMIADKSNKKSAYVVAKNNWCPEDQFSQDENCFICK